MESIKISNAILYLIQGDITKQKTDAIVNAANSSLMGGGGVDGAIHYAGGPSILNECKKIIEKIGHLATGEAVITTGGDLSAKYVIHTVGPFWRDGNHNEQNLLANAYKNSLKLALEKGLKTISFPSISTGAYRYPINEATKIALEAVVDFIKKEKSIEEVHFVLFGQDTYKIYKNALKYL
ncbi:MAG: O-acetyl-ADP-ribose deacetylase [Candidatus Firestonebacteria bacterium]|nr:O-acetyl-ADP-ribose deacetylase [Candidatus Firestonebacteria bacterium]